MACTPLRLPWYGRFSDGMDYSVGSFSVCACVSGVQRRHSQSPAPLHCGNTAAVVAVLLVRQTADCTMHPCVIYVCCSTYGAGIPPAAEVVHTGWVPPPKQQQEQPGLRGAQTTAAAGSASVQWSTAKPTPKRCGSAASYQAATAICRP